MDIALGRMNIVAPAVRGALSSMLNCYAFPITLSLLDVHSQSELVLFIHPSFVPLLFSRWNNIKCFSLECRGFSGSRVGGSRPDDHFMWTRRMTWKLENGYFILLYRVLKYVYNKKVVEQLMIKLTFNASYNRQ